MNEAVEAKALTAFFVVGAECWHRSEEATGGTVERSASLPASPAVGNELNLPRGEAGGLTA
jgi:hypothetical protein